MYSTSYDQEAELWYGRDIPPLYNPEISVAQALIGSMVKYSPKIAQISDDDGYETSFGEILAMTVRAAQNLQSLGYKPKQVFGLMGRNSRFVTPIIIASMAIGCPVHMIDPFFSKAELLHMLIITTPTLMFCDNACYGLLKSCLDELQIRAKIFTFGESEVKSEPVEKLFRDTFREREFVPVKIDGSNDTAIIICTSGSTDLPKGVCVSHAALLNGLSQVSMTIDNAIGLSYMSIRGLSGISMLLAGILHGVTSILVTGTFTPEQQLYLIEKYKVTHMLTVPHQVVLMMNSEHLDKTDFSSLKFVFVGGDRVPLHLKIALQKHIPNGMVCVGMAMTELGNIASEYPPTRKDTVGKLVDGNWAKVVDEDGNRCGVNIDGELCIKTNTKFLGYYENRQATAESLDEEGFFKTGDIVHFDDDGYLHVVDRKKSLLKYCTTNIYPSTIETFLTESPEIKAVCVVGIPDPKGMGDLVTAVVVRAGSSNISEQKVYDMVAGKFSDNYKLRGGVYFVDALPLTSTSKVLRRKVKETAIKMYNARSFN